jgi:5,5'-dehydrodivanillate O-demethylase
MLSALENEQLTRVGAGTPMGELQRRYWHPIAGVEELRDAYTKRVRLLGEDLVLFRDRSGRLGLIAEFCPHRRASLAYGIPEIDGIRCPYHGWKFDETGACTDQPNEPAGSTFKDRVRASGYSVQALGGMIFAYLGPQPAPLLPKWDGFVAEGAIRHVGQAIVPCNWLQIMENSLDPVHTEWLHGHLQEFVEEKAEQAGTRYQISRHHLQIAFDEFPYGIYKRRLLAGAPEDSDDWRVGHPILFPNILAVGSGGGHLWKVHAYQMRVPIDDENTLHYWYMAYEPPPGVDVPPALLERTARYDFPYRDATGEFRLNIVDAQDVMAWITQGPIAKRELEKLGTTDSGVILYRKILQRELAKVARGEDPMGVIRSEAENDALTIPVERDKAHFTDGFESHMRRTQVQHSPFAADLKRVFADFSRQRLAEKIPILNHA